MNMEELIRFTKMSEKGLISKALVRAKIDELTKESEGIEKKLDGLSSQSGDTPEDNTTTLLQEKTRLKEILDFVWDCIASLQIDLEENKHFDKKVCFRNIRELIKNNPNVRLGQIENEAGLRAGYMSRLEKDSNMTEPSLEFVVTAAKMLEVSIDALLMVDMTGLTDTERYLSKFIERMKKDTLSGLIKWNRENAKDLNSSEISLDEDELRPLFVLERDWAIDNENGCPETIMAPRFISHNYGKYTHIHDDCFNFQIEDGMRVYLMDIEKIIHAEDTKKECAKEIWMWSKKTDGQYILSNRGSSPLSYEVDTIFNIVREHTNRPEITEDIYDSIEKFMNKERGDAL